MDTVQGAVADAAGKDYLQGRPWSISNRARHIKGVGFVGGINPGDSYFDVLISGNFMGSVYNSRGGANLSFQYLTDLQLFDFVAGPGELIQAVLRLNAGTNKLVATFDFVYLG